MESKAIPSTECTQRYGQMHYGAVVLIIIRNVGFIPGNHWPQWPFQFENSSV